MPKEISSLPTLPKELRDQGFKDWALPGMPPLPIKELGSHQLSEDTRAVFIEGHHVELGVPHNGLSGHETLVFEQKQPDGSMRILREMPEHVAAVLEGQPQQTQRKFRSVA